VVLTVTVAIRYRLPVACMTSCFHIIGHYVVYGEAYSQRMSVSGIQRRDGPNLSAAAPPLSAVPAAD